MSHLPDGGGASGKRLSLADIRSEWGLDFTRLHVNHGSYGAAPRVVLAEQQRWRDQMESGLTYFMQDILPGALRASAARLAAYVGVSGDDLVFVDNATAGANAVLASLRLGEGDEVLLHSHSYGAVTKTVRHAAEAVGARIVTVDLPFPDPTPGSIEAAFAAALTPRTRLAIIDHITSPSALIFPVAALTRLCHEAGALVLIDGAHAPGHVPLDITATGADYYTGNCHKWLMSPKGAGFLWARRDLQEGLHPTIISHSYGAGFAAEFDWTGTRDWSAALAVPTAIDFHNGLGGEALMAANRELAWEAGSSLARRWGTRLAASRGMFGAMTLVGAPFPKLEPDGVLSLRKRLRAAGADAPVVVLGDQSWIRLSAQAYNAPEDYERLGDIVDRVTGA